MNHVHRKSCSSTQDLLIEDIKRSTGNYLQNPTLISTENQETGRGRGKNQWVQFQNSLAFSIALKACEQVTLTSLEIGVLLVEYFQQHHNVKLALKWPNDLLTPECQKVGGIICHNTGGVIAVGIGINIQCVENFDENANFDYPHSFVKIKSEIEHPQKSVPLDIFNFILKNRKTCEQIITKWNSYCCHLNKEIEVIDDANKTCGNFLGIGEIGQAIVLPLSSKKPIEIYSGSLRIL
ncbi:MAG: biotin--[acetyl-CoA-carboxylase] ligase [Bacteriovoracaceae bacterium]|jgi:biotin-[acetyl-CoA-carboxylase] ligase BirA-like protein|nr:biotin--[acetyl-CoA-carboxylase] ligase [Bacteriovoracaceae bacterium]